MKIKKNITQEIFDKKLRALNRKLRKLKYSWPISYYEFLSNETQLVLPILHQPFLKTNFYKNRYT